MSHQQHSRRPPLGSRPGSRLGSRLSDLLADLLDRSGEQAGLHAQACATMLSNLDLYVSDELDGINVQARHPALWGHLQQCAECRAEYESLRDLLAAEMSGALAGAGPWAAEAPPDAATEPAAVAGAWELKSEYVSGRREPALQFIFAPAYLQQSLRAAGHGADFRLAETRAIYGDEPEEGTLLLSYVREIAGEELLVKLYARATGDSASTLLHLEVVGDFAPHLAQLAWAGLRWQAELGPDGRAMLGPVPLDVLSQPAPAADAFTLRLIP